MPAQTPSKPALEMTWSMAAPANDWIVDSRVGNDVIYGGPVSVG